MKPLTELVRFYCETPEDLDPINDRVYEAFRLICILCNQKGLTPKIVESTDTVLRIILDSHIRKKVSSLTRVICGACSVCLGPEVKVVWTNELLDCYHFKIYDRSAYAKVQSSSENKS